LAKITLVLAKELALAETREMIETAELDLPLDFVDAALPLDNLDANIVSATTPCSAPGQT